MEGAVRAENGDDGSHHSAQGGTVCYSAGSDRAIAGTLGVATVSGLTAGLNVGVAAPRQLRLLSYSVFGGASIVLLITLVLVGMAVTTPGSSSSDGGA